METYEPRPLAADERPQRGDVFLEHGKSLVGAVIRLEAIADGRILRVNHTGVVLDVDEDGWHTAEAHAGHGHRAMTRPHLDGLVVRISDDPAVRERVAAHAEDRLGLEYDMLSIVRMGVLTLGELAARFHLGPIALVALWLLTKIPLNDNPQRVICSDVTRQAIEHAVGHQLPGLEGLPTWQTSPADLGDALLARRLVRG